VRLGDLIAVKHGWAFKSKHFNEDLTGRPIVVSVGNFRYTGGFRFEETTTKEYRGEYPEGYELAPGDVLVIMTCQTAGGEILGVPARVPDDGRVYLHNQRLGKVVIKDGSQVDAGYLYWLFLWRDFNRELVGSASGTKILHTAPSRIEAFQFDLPPLNEQRGIARILGTLDDKIELNRRMSETLEAMARALFKSWFVDFEPVRAKAEGRHAGLPKNLADLFPDSLRRSSEGDIPAGWDAGTLADLAVHLRENENPLDSPELFFQHFSIPAFDEGRWPAQELGASIRSQKTRVPPGTVLLSRLNPEIDRVWLVEIEPGYRAVCSTEFLVLAPRPPHGQAFLYCLARSPEFRQQLEGRVTGTSKSHQRAQTPAVLGIAVVRAANPVVACFECEAGALLSRAQQCRRDSRTLGRLRESLLPKLISGEIRTMGAPLKSLMEASK